MLRLLVPLGSCSTALELSPLLRACGENGISATVAWFGADSAFAEARELGLPEPALRRTPVAGSNAAVHFAEATAFVAAALASGEWCAVLSSGQGAAALAAGILAARQGVPVVRLAAGLRTHDATCADERNRRLADHSASAWFVAHDMQRQELLREGLPAARIRVVGSLLPAALRALPQAERIAEPFLWLALEHAVTVQERTVLTGLLAHTAAAARTHSVTVRAVATVLDPALERLAVPLPAGITSASFASARAQLDAARSARIVVTDSSGYQELAAVLGVPCILLGAQTGRPETVAAGACELVDATSAGLGDAIARALGRRRPPDPVYADGLASILAQLPGLVAPSPAAANGPACAPALPGAQPGGLPSRLPSGLPSDGDHTGRTLGNDEVALASAAIRSGTLNSTRGTFVARCETEFARWLGRKHAIACASGSAAMHCAVAALGLQPGDEVITTPITDMGALVPILYEGGVPVFADVDPCTLNVTAATLRAQVTARTRAVVVTHLFGLPCDMQPILQMARERNLAVIEDSAQAFGATCGEGKAGTFGTLAAFSLQQGKHITCGEGGIVATDDDALARRVFLCVNKGWGYGDARPDHYFPALNYRLTELQGAVLLAQLPKLDWVIARRRQVAAALRIELASVPGLMLPADPLHGTHSYWKFAFFVDPAVIEGGAQALGKRMQGAGVACAPRYIQKPAFECALFLDWHKSPVTSLPLQHNPRRDSRMPLFVRSAYPGAVRALDQVVVLPINERYTEPDIATVAAVIRTAAAELQHA